MKRLTDPGFKYVPSHETNVAKTFKRIRRERKKKEEEEQKIAQEQQQKLVRMRR